MTRLPDGRGNSDLNLASPDEDTRVLAVEHHLRTITFAAEAGLGYVVVHLGGVGDVTTEWERELKSLWTAGTRSGERIEELRDLCRRHRDGGRDLHLEAAHRSLRQLTSLASVHGIAIGLENRLQYHEFPHPEDAEVLLSGYTNDVAGYWHDVGHAEVQHRLGLIDLSGWFPRLTARTIGTHLHDVNGITDHRAPGNGDVDWRYLAAALPATAIRVCEIDQHEPDRTVAGASAFLRARGVVA
jgi:sugar phosphate isomerase/epimerase